MSLMLNKFIRATLQERVRSVVFKWNEFKELQTPQECDDYAKKHLQFIGQGSSRNSYVLTSKKVLKIARPGHEYGTEQNKREVVNSYEVKPYQEFFTVLFDNAFDCRWIVSELVNPVKSMKEVHEFFGIYPGFLSGVLISVLKGKELDELIQQYSVNEQKSTKFIEMIIWAKNNDIEISDWSGKDQWGRTTDGRIVILDYGI